MTTIKKVLTNPKYLLLTLSISIILIVFATWLPNYQLVTGTLTNSSMTLGQKTNLLIALVGSFNTNFTLFSQLAILITATLTGFQFSLMVYYLKQSARLHRSMGLSSTGVIAGMIGIGCASCGSVILVSILGITTATSLLSILPFRGTEFSLLGMALLLVAIIMTTNKINQPISCATKTKPSP